MDLPRPLLSRLGASSLMPSQQNEPPWLKLVRYSLVAFYLVAGTAHIAFPAPFLAITPAWVPNPKLTIFATGLCELAGAIGLLTQRFRRAAGIALAVYAACVLPANIKHALNSLSATNVSDAAWVYHVIRLSVQPLIIWWALLASGIFHSDDG